MTVVDHKTDLSSGELRKKRILPLFLGLALNICVLHSNIYPGGDTLEPIMVQSSDSLWIRCCLLKEGRQT